MSDYERHNIFNPEDKLSDLREFEIYKKPAASGAPREPEVRSLAAKSNDDNLEKVITYKIDKKIYECHKEIEEYEAKIKELKKNLKIYERDKKEILEAINKYL